MGEYTFSNIAKVNGIAVASFSKLNGILNENVMKLNGRPVWKIYADFTAANGTAVSAYSSNINVPGNAWVNTNISGGTAVVDIQGNKARPYNGGTGAALFVTTDTAISDLVIYADYVAGSTTGGTGIAFRTTDATNYWMAVARQTDNTMRIYEKTGAGALTSRASAAKTLTNGVTYKMKLTLSGTSITFVLDGTSISYTSSVRQTVTKHGIGTLSGNTSVYMDRFRI